MKIYGPEIIINVYSNFETIYELVGVYLFTWKFLFFDSNLRLINKFDLLRLMIQKKKVNDKKRFLLLQPSDNDDSILICQEYFRKEFFGKMGTTFSA